MVVAWCLVPIKTWTSPEGVGSGGLDLHCFTSHKFDGKKCRDLNCQNTLNGFLQSSLSKFSSMWSRIPPRSAVHSTLLASLKSWERQLIFQNSCNSSVIRLVSIFLPSLNISSGDAIRSWGFTRMWMCNGFLELVQSRLAFLDYPADQPETVYEIIGKIIYLSLLYVLIRCNENADIKVNRFIFNVRRYSLHQRSLFPPFRSRCTTK